MKDRPEEAKTVDHRYLPVGTVIVGKTKGTYQALPLFGWVALRHRTNTPLVMLTTLLLGEEGPVGSLSIELPVFPETEDATLAVLDRFGWDGRVWPADPGWPTGSPDDEGNILMLMDQAKSLKATMTFPPGPNGNATQQVTVSRLNGPFLMPPLPEAEPGQIDEAKRARLRQLCENPRVFTGQDSAPKLVEGDESSGPAKAEEAPAEEVAEVDSTVGEC